MKSYKLAVCLFALFLVLIGLWFGNVISLPIALAPTQCPLPSQEDLTVRKNEQSDKPRSTMNSGSTIVPMSTSKPRLLNVGGLALPVQFQDFSKTQLSDSQCAEVIKDLKRIYGHFEQYETYDIDLRVLRLNGVDVPITKRIAFVGRGRYFPDAHRNSFGLLSGDPDNFNLVIPAELAELYKHALEFRTLHKVAFDELETFLEMVNSQDAAAWTGVRPDDIISLSDSLKEIPNLSERIFAELKSVKVREPSILDFSINEANSKSGSSELPDGTIMGKAMICDKNSIPTRYQAIVYFNNKWHLLISNTGT